MTSQEKFIAVMEGRPVTGLVPHFELAFFLTMEAFGRIHPLQRVYNQWGQMSDSERKLHIDDIASLYVAIARKYDHCAIFFQHVAGWDEEAHRRCMDRMQELYQEPCNIMMHADSTFELPSGNDMMAFSVRMIEDPNGLKQEAEKRLADAVACAKRMKKWNNINTLALCADYCFNTNPFFSPVQFEEFVYPYLKRLIEAYRELGFYVIKHTDGNIMPILDMLIDANPHALHSLDPQGGVDIAEVKRIVDGRISLIGNVNCGALQTGTDDEVESSVRYALKSGMPGFRYIFSTSNCVYTGMDLARYETMLQLWQKYGRYQG